MIPEPAQWAINLGTALGAGLATIYARRAAKSSDNAASNSQSVKNQTKSVQTEMIGPDGEPSIRVLITDSQRSLQEHRQEMSAMFRGLHSDVEDLGERMQRVEKTYSGMEDRLKVVERVTQESTVLSTAVSSMGKLVNTLAGSMERAQANIHLIANAVQLRLLSPEEVEKPAPKE